MSLNEESITVIARFGNYGPPTVAGGQVRIGFHNTLNMYKLKEVQWGTTRRATPENKLISHRDRTVWYHLSSGQVVS